MPKLLKTSVTLLPLKVSKDILNSSLLKISVPLWLDMKSLILLKIIWAWLKAGAYIPIFMPFLNICNLLSS